MLSTSFDQDADALYIKLAHGEVARTVDLDEGTLVDLDEGGKALGVEVIHPAGDWPVEEFITRFDLDPATARLVRLSAESARRLGTSFHQSNQVVTSGRTDQLISC